MKTLVDAKNSKCQTLLALFQNGGSCTACVQLELNPAVPAVLRFGSLQLPIVAISHEGGGAKTPAAPLTAPLLLHQAAWAVPGSAGDMRPRRAPSGPAHCRDRLPL